MDDQQVSLSNTMVSGGEVSYSWHEASYWVNNVLPPYTMAKAENGDGGRNVMSP